MNSEPLYDLLAEEGATSPRRFALVLRGILQHDLRVQLPDNASLETPLRGRALTWGTLITGDLHYLERGGVHLNHFRRRYNSIEADPADVKKLLAKGAKAARGPRMGTSGYGEHDRRAFPEIERLIRSGKAGSPFGAALLLAKRNRLAGRGTVESIAKRTSDRYRREHH